MSFQTILSKTLLVLLLAAPAWAEPPKKVEQEGRGELEDSGVTAALEARLEELGYAADSESFAGAVVRGDLAAVEIFLKLGQSPNVALDDDQQLMVLAAWCCEAKPKDKRTPILKALLAAGGDPNTRDDNKMVPLVWAASYCDAEGVKALLDAGAEVNPDVGGNISPLTAAKSAKRRDIVALLKKAGAKEN
jgi:hypothetical protein